MLILWGEEEWFDDVWCCRASGCINRKRNDWFFARAFSWETRSPQRPPQNKRLKMGVVCSHHHLGLLLPAKLNNWNPILHQSHHPCLEDDTMPCMHTLCYFETSTVEEKLEREKCANVGFFGISKTKTCFLHVEVHQPSTSVCCLTLPQKYSTCSTVTYLSWSFARRATNLQSLWGITPRISKSWRERTPPNWNWQKQKTKNLIKYYLSIAWEPMQFVLSSR